MMTADNPEERVSFVYLVRWVPDPIRDEAENVGVIVCDGTGSRCVSRRKDGVRPVIEEFFADPHREYLDWAVDNAFNCVQVRRMASVAPWTLEEILDEAWQRFVA